MQLLQAVVLMYCCAGISAGNEVVVSVTTPFYCSQCSSTGRQQSSSQTI